MKFLKSYWRHILSAWIAFVFLQSLFFKFAGSYETEYIFGTLGEFFHLAWFAAYGAYLVGIAELVASILLFSRYWAWGAFLAFEIMSGAIVFHLFTPLGIVMPAFDDAGQKIGDDAGLLFFMACITGLSALVIVVYDWTSENSQIRKTFKKNGAVNES